MPDRRAGGGARPQPLNERYLPGVELPRELRVRAARRPPTTSSRADLVFLGVPSKGCRRRSAELAGMGVSERAGIVSLAKGLVPPDGTRRPWPSRRVFGSQRVACVGGPSHAREMVESGAGLVCASRSEALAHGVAEAFQRAGVVCEVSDDPVGVELAGVAKNAAAVAVGATQAQGLNAAGMAAADIFLEVLALAGAQRRPRAHVRRPRRHRRPRGHGAGPSSRNRSAGELLAQGVPGAEIPARMGQAVEALETVPPAGPRDRARGLEAPVISALARLIEGTMPLDDWIALVRAKQPPPARFRRPRTWWARLREGVCAADGRARIDRTMKTEIHPEYVAGPRALHLRQRVLDSLHQARAPRGDLLRLPPVLHG